MTYYVKPHFTPIRMVIVKKKKRKKGRKGGRKKITSIGEDVGKKKLELFFIAGGDVK